MTYKVSATLILPRNSSIMLNRDRSGLNMLHLICLLIGVFSIHSVSSTVTNDVDPSQPCNSCCQGPSGHNGPPGRDGRDGFQGQKGEIGTGLVGERGLAGPEGPRGQTGDVGIQGVPGPMGHPGEVGPRGLIGERGPLGGKGDKGEIGQKGESGPAGGRSRRCAFTAIKESEQTGSSGDAVIYEITETNIGNDFDNATGKFTCRIPGVYWFTLTMQPDSTNPFVDLVKNDDMIIKVYFYEGTSGTIWTPATNGAVLELEVGDQVWVRFGSTGQTIYGRRRSTFSGFLLYED